MLIDGLLRRCGRPVQPVVTPSTPSDLPVLPADFGLASALARVGGDRVLYAERVTTFINARSEVLAELRGVVLSGDARQLARQLRARRGLAA